MDDSEKDRSILSDILEDEFDILEAADGAEAVAALYDLGTRISLVLLDIVMPRLDCFEVLGAMNKHHWIEEIPVIMISEENASSYVQNAYELGVTDSISRPFDCLVVRKRVENTIMLYAKQQKLIGMVTDQIYEKQKNSSLMVEILSGIVEFRNGESGLHVIHIRTMTDLLLRYMEKKHLMRYPVKHEDIPLIGTASALHDIGKIGIPNKILNKPGSLTREEFEIMKTHTLLGADMLKNLPCHQDEPLMKMAYEICRWHHERYDGRGYPDGLKGDEIPISAQIVSLADVYDALTSERIYKKAFSHEKAVKMILDGECGVFNPILLECLKNLSERIREETKSDSLGYGNHQEIQEMTEEMLRHEELAASARALRLLERERTKYQFFASVSREVQFEYTNLPPVLTLSEWGARKLGLEEIIVDPYHSEKCRSLSCGKDMQMMAQALHGTTPEQPIVQQDCEIWMGGELRWERIVCRATWSQEEPPRYLGVIGKIVDIPRDSGEAFNLQRMASRDSLTGLLNQEHSRKSIWRILKEHPEKSFVLAILDLDHFQAANDQYGYIFGDQVLKCTADRLRAVLEEGDLATRIGGDEFLLFMEEREGSREKLERIRRELCQKVDEFPMSASMGFAKTSVAGRDAQELFDCADIALYAAKLKGEGRCCAYDDSMKLILKEKAGEDWGKGGPAEGGAR